MRDTGGMRAMYRVFAFDLVAKVAIGVAMLLIIRMMPTAEYANYTFALSAAALAQQGVIAAFNRVYIVGHETLRLGGAEWGFVGVQLALFGAIAVLLFPFRDVFGGAYGPLLALVAATTLAEAAKTFYQRDLRFREFSFVEIGRALLFVALVLAAGIVLRRHMRAGHALLAQALAMLLAFVVATRHLPPPTRAAANQLRILLGDVLLGRYRNLLLYFVATAAFAQVEVFVLRRLATPEVLATFGASFRYYVLLSLALGAVHTVLLPIIQRARLDGTLREVVRRQQRLLAVFVPVVVLGAWLSAWIIPLIDGGRYPESIAVFRVLCASAIVSFALSPYSNVLISDGEFRFMLVSVLVASALSLGLNVVLVPRLGALGAALTMLVAFGLFNGATFLRARAIIRRGPRPVAA